MPHNRALASVRARAQHELAVIQRQQPLHKPAAAAAALSDQRVPQRPQRCVVVTGLHPGCHSVSARAAQQSRGRQYRR